MFSMTGYGKASLTIEDKEMVIELKAVNHRFLDLNIKLPKILASVEDVIRKTIQKDVARGRVDVFVTFQNKSADGVSFLLDEGVAKAYYDVSRQMLSLIKVEDDLNLTSMLKVPDVLRQEIKEVDGENELFLLEDCINTYFEAVDKKEKTAVYALLNKDYLSKNNIDNTNVLENIYSLNNGFEKFIIKEAYSKEISFDREYQYYVYGELLGENYTTIQGIYMLINLDIQSKTFNIGFEDNVEMNKEKYLDTIDYLLKNNTNEAIEVGETLENGIKQNGYNTYETESKEIKYFLNKYMDNYITMATYYPEIAYNLLNIEYREKKFNDIKEYKEYIANKSNEMSIWAIKEYSIEEKEDYTEYTVIDTNENTYIFRITDIMEYTVILDTYTLNLESVYSKYDESNVQMKTAININKIVSAINDEDYKYIYSKLDDSFKNNYYKTYEKFEKYMLDNFIGKLELKFNNFSNEGEIYIYEITLNGTTVSNNQEIKMQVVMKLKEDRDFVMSFNIDEKSSKE